MQRIRLVDIMASSLPNSLGDCQGDLATIAGKVNEAQLRLLHDPLQPDEGWFGTWERMAFNVDTSNNSITPPRRVARITGLTVCKRPVVIRNDFWETMEFGNGLMPPNCEPTCQVLTVYGRGMVPTFKDISGTKGLRAYISNDADVGKRILFQGLDANGVTVRTQDGLSSVEGEYVDLDSPFADAANNYTKITGIQKDITFGEVQIFSVDPDTGAEVKILTMEPSEQTAWYQRYFLNGLPGTCPCGDTVQIEGIAKLEFVPLRVSTDYCLINSLPAIIEECKSIRYMDMDIPAAKQLSAEHHSRALQYLAGLASHVIGKERVSIKVPLWNSDRLRPQPI